MIVGFGANNIKACNLNKSIEIKPITILMGENSSGKTSFLQGLSLLTMNKILGNDIKRIKYNNPFHKLGTISEFKNINNDVGLIFVFKDKSDLKYDITLFYNNDEKSNEYGFLNCIVLTYEKFKKEVVFNYQNEKYFTPLDEIFQGKEKLFNKKIIENSEKIWFETDFKTLQIDSYPKDIEEEIVKSFKNFKILEENLKEIFDILRENIDSIKHISKIQNIQTVYNYDNDYIGYNGEEYKELAKNLKDKTFLENAIKRIFGYELAEIDEDGEFFLNQKFKIEIQKDIDSNQFHYSHDYIDNINELNIKENNNKLFLIEDDKKVELIKVDDEIYKYYINQPLKLPMFGSSINNIIPILTQFARNREEPEKYNVTIVEEPEIGLHPQAQAKFIEVLFGEDDYYKTQTTILETHSDHIVNKLRYLVFKGKVSPDDVVIYYKTKESDEFIKININEFGEFGREFPSGFYDATIKELLEMKRAKRKNASS